MSASAVNVADTSQPPLDVALSGNSLVSKYGPSSREVYLFQRKLGGLHDDSKKKKKKIFKTRSLKICCKRTISMYIESIPKYLENLKHAKTFGLHQKLSQL